MELAGGKIKDNASIDSFCSLCNFNTSCKILFFFYYIIFFYELQLNFFTKWKKQLFSVAKIIMLCYT